MVVTILVMRLKHINTIRERSPGGETILALVSINCKVTMFMSTITITTNTNTNTNNYINVRSKADK